MNQNVRVLFFKSVLSLMMGAGIASAAPPTLAPGVPAEISIESWLKGDVILIVPNAAQNDAVYVYAGPPTFLGSRAQRGCKLTLGRDGTLALGRGAASATTACQQLEKFWADDGRKLTIEHIKSDSFLEARVSSLPQPRTHEVAADELATFSHPQWAPAGSAVYFRDPAGSLQEERVATVGAAAGTGLNAALNFTLLAQNGGLKAYYVIGGGVVGVEFQLKKVRADPGTTPQRYSDADFRKDCDDEQLRATKAERNQYLVCVDYTHLTAPTIRIVTTGDLKDSRAADGHLWANRGMIVSVFHAPSHRAAAELSGDPGQWSTLYVAGGAALAAEAKAANDTPADKRQLTRFEFSSRKGPSTTLKLTLSNDEKAVAVNQFPFSVERQYTAALRTGLSVLYSHWDTTYAARARGGANDGKEVVVDESATTTVDLTIGLSFFFCSVDEHDYTPIPGIYFGLGLLSTGTKDPEALSALLIGPELSFGKDLSLAAVAGLRRTEQLKDGYDVGSALPGDASDAPTAFAVTPSFGIMLNLSPVVWERAK